MCGRIPGAAVRSLLDRIDLHVRYRRSPPPVDSAAASEAAGVAARVARGDIQAERYAAMGLGSVRTDAQSERPALEAVTPGGRGMALLRGCCRLHALSARGYHRILRVTYARRSGRGRICRRVHLAGRSPIARLQTKYRVQRSPSASHIALCAALTTFARTTGWMISW
jgi:magnesium chelatase family protein